MDFKNVTDIDCEYEYLGLDINSYTRGKNTVLAISKDYSVISTSLKSDNPNEQHREFTIKVAFRDGHAYMSGSAISESEGEYLAQVITETDCYRFIAEDATAIILCYF